MFCLWLRLSLYDVNIIINDVVFNILRVFEVLFQKKFNGGKMLFYLFLESRIRGEMLVVVINDFVYNIFIGYFVFVMN